MGHYISFDFTPDAIECVMCDKDGIVWVETLQGMDIDSRCLEAQGLLFQYYNNKRGKDD